MRRNVWILPISFFFVCGLEYAAEDQKSPREILKEHIGDRFQVADSLSVEELLFTLRLKIKDEYYGASVFSQEEEPVFLGTIESQFSSKSIFNNVGQYGSNVSSRSIWNDVGRYGSEVSSYSARNSVTSKPPVIIKGNKVIGFLTVNKIIRDGIDPHLLKYFFTE